MSRVLIHATYTFLTTCRRPDATMYSRRTPRPLAFLLLLWVFALCTVKPEAVTNAAVEGKFCSTAVRQKICLNTLYKGSSRQS